jgi:hypothetical protein
MDKAVRSAKRGAFQRDLGTAKPPLNPGQRLILERRLALICRMERELKKHRRWCASIAVQ